MAVERELRRLLEYAKLPVAEANQTKSVENAKDEEGNQDDATVFPTRVPVKPIYDRLRCVCRQQTLPTTSFAADCNVPELLALLAEAAVYQQDTETARGCVAWFLSDYSAKNQFYCRMQLVRAECASTDAAHNTGAVRLRKVLDAIRFVLLVLPVATDPKRRPQYDFLVYNASVTYWRVARQVMKKATFQYLLPSLTAIIDALKLVGERDVPWLVRLQITLVHAQIDAKQLAAAAKLVCDIVDVQFPPLLNDPARSNDAPIKVLYEEALRLQVHVGSFKDPECQKVLANLKKGAGNKRLSLVTKLQALKSGAFAGTLDAALTELFQETTGMTTFASSTTTDDEIMAYLRGLDAANSQSVDGEILVEVGIIAAFRQEYRHATCCDVVLQTKGKSVEPSVRVLHQVLKAILLALVPPPASANFKLTRSQRATLVVTRHLDGVKAIERALFACKRQHNPTLLENVCLYAWNLSLPLLQPQSRDQLVRLYSLASSSLEEIQSLQLNLRVRLMLELAKLELSADFISKAQENVHKALGLDYGTITPTASSSPSLDEFFANEAKWLRRPLDIHLLPLRTRLDGKLAVDDPSSTAEELTAAVEQLREAKSAEQRKRQLDRVLIVVNNVLQERSSGNQALSIDLLLHLNTTSAFAWHEMKDAVNADKLTREALRLFFSEPPQQNQQCENDSVFSDKSVMLLEVDLRLRLVELIGHEVKTRAQRYQAAVAAHEGVQSGKKNVRDTAVGSRTQASSVRDEQVVDGAAMLLLTKESHALGISVSATGSASSGDNNDQIILDRRATMESELLGLKTELIQELNAALRVATRIGWGFVIENTAVYLWNYHFHVFRSILLPVGSSGPSPAILSECIAAFEATLVALEVLPAAVLNLELLTCIALGLALVQERAGKLDKAIAIADNILKRQKASTTTLPTSLTAVPSISLVLLKRFGELKVRVQIQQNAKEVVPVDITPQVKVVSLLEAMEVTFHQHATNTALPPAQLAQLMEKATSFLQKAMAAWQPIAHESLECIQNESLMLEEQQQHLELYCEIWVRLACGAFRIHNIKQAIDCGERAHVPITKHLSESDQRVWVTDATWRWLALAELLCGRSILALLSGETAAWTLIDATLQHLVRATQYAVRAGAFSVVRKVAEVSWNAVITAMAAVEAERAVGESNEDGGEAQWWSKLLPQLLEILKAIGEGESGRLLGEFGLLVLDVCEKASDWKTAMSVAGNLIHSTSTTIPSSQLKDITTVHAIAVASMGEHSSSSGSGGKGKDHDPLMQAKILRKIAFSSWRNPPAQLKALAAAHKELDGRPQEQALVLMEMAEWFFTHQFPRQEVHAHLDAAMSILVRGQQKREGTDLKVGSRATSVLEYAPLWYADKLIQLFTMRAISAASMHERWEFVRHAMHQVFTAWQCIVDVANDADLRDQFVAEAQADASVTFDEWKVDKSRKFAASVPRRAVEWIAFYQQYATSLASRFYMPWVAGLSHASSSESKQQTITNPNLTGAMLEHLLRLLASCGAVELSLPVICLYQVVFFAFSPQKSKAMEMWLELTTYDALEKLNLPVFNVPLQSALELLQTSGDAILKELQQQKDSTIVSAGGAFRANARHRSLLQLAAINVSDKVAQTVTLLLQCGFVRHAKVMLTMLHNVVHRFSTESEMNVRCEELRIQVRMLEGDEHGAVESIHRLLSSPTSHIEFDMYIQLALLVSEHTSDKYKAIDALLKSEQLAADAILSASECVLLRQPMHMQTVTKYLTSLATTTTKANVLTENVDMDTIVGLARLKLRRASLLLEAESSVASAERAQGVFQEATELLRCIDASNELAALKTTFAKQLIAFATTCEARVRDWWLLEARGLLREALVLWADMQSRAFQPTAIRGGASLLEIKIAKLKLRLSALEMDLEESAPVVTDQQMTWYKHEKAMRQTIVDKWLDQTASHVPIKRPGNLSSAFALASAAGITLAKCPDSLDVRGLATVYRLRCERLKLYHESNKELRETVHRLVWTRFTSTQAPQETWICAATHTRTTEDNGRTTPALTVTETPPTPYSDEELQVQQQLCALAASLEAEMKVAIDKRHDHVVSVCAYELAQVYGCSQPLACAKALLQYQSTVVRERQMKPVVEQCLASANVTRLHMQRCETLSRRHTNAFQNSLPFQLSQLFLEQQSDIYKRMNVSVSIDTVLQSLPPTKRVLSLQLSPDRCFLYVALVSNTDKCVAVARMECTTTKLEQLETLRIRIRAWRAGMTKALLSVDDMSKQGAQHDTREFVAISGEAVPATETDPLEREFESFVDAMTEFFSPLFAHSALAAILENELPGNSLVLVVDREFELLPLEALPAFEKADAVSREFSIHLLYHRLVTQKAHPFRKDDVRTIVDPRSDDTGLLDQTLSSVVHQLTKKAGAAFPNWKNAVDHGFVPSATDWQHAMLQRKSGALVYVGPNRAIGSLLRLETLAGMNVATACSALVLLDRAENQSSARRQSKIDSDKARWELALEDDVFACALLCSLCGVNCVVLNQWASTFDANRRLASALFSGFAKGQSVARAVRKYPETVAPVVAPASTAQAPRKASIVAPTAVKYRLKNRIRFATAVFGLGNLSFKGNE